MAIKLELTCYSQNIIGCNSGLICNCPSLFEIEFFICGISFLFSGSFTTDSQTACIYEQNVYTVEPGKVQVRTFQVCWRHNNMMWEGVRSLLEAACIDFLTRKIEYKLCLHCSLKLTTFSIGACFVSQKLMKIYVALLIKNICVFLNISLILL